VTKRLAGSDLLLITVQDGIIPVEQRVVADPNADRFSFPGDAAEQRAGRVMGANDKFASADQKLKRLAAPDKVQSGTEACKSLP